MGLLGWWGRFVYRRRWLVLVVSVLTLGVSAASLLAGGQLRNVPFRDTEAGRTNQLIRDEFPRPTGAPLAAATASFVLIFTSTAGGNPAAQGVFGGDKGAAPPPRADSAGPSVVALPNVLRPARAPRPPE